MPLITPLAVCLIAALVAGNARTADPSFALSQQGLTRLSTHAVDGLVGTAPDPRGGNRRGTPSCRPGTLDDLRNPWSCRIVYRGGFRTRYRVTISPRGSYVGRRLDDAGEISGCCVSLGTS